MLNNVTDALYLDAMALDTQRANFYHIEGKLLFNIYCAHCRRIL